MNESQTSKKKYTRETGSVTHPNGVKFTSVSDFVPVKLKSVGWVGVLDLTGKEALGLNTRAGLNALSQTVGITM